MDSWAFLDELVCLPLMGQGNNLESILLISPVANLSDSVYPLQGAGITVLSIGGWDTHSSALSFQTQHPEPHKGPCTPAVLEPGREKSDMI
jgi:hypothetical protein